MSGQIDPFNNPSAWDVMQIGGMTTPGVCRLQKPERKAQFDKKKGNSADGGTTTFQGKILAEFKAKFELWEPDHFVAWDSIRPRLNYDPAKGRPVAAVDVYHPSLADLDITSCVVETLGGIVDEGDGLYSLEIEFLEYRPPSKTSAVSTPTQSGDSSDPDAVKPYPQILALQKQFSDAMAQARAAYAP